MENMKAKRAVYRTWKKGYYHLCTDGWKEGVLFHTLEQWSYGMTIMGLAALRYKVTVYAFTLMPNHIHILLSGDGRQCADVFSYLRRKLSLRLKTDGYPMVPEQYGYKLIPVTNEDQMRVNYLYLFRNAYEKAWAVPAGYPWSSCWLCHSMLASHITGKRADTMSKRELERITGSDMAIPGHWEFHPSLGLLPSSFVSTDLFNRLFPTVKAYETRLVKDYEAFVRMASSLDESLSLSVEETKDIVSALLRDHFEGKPAGSLTPDEKSRLARMLQSDYQFTAGQIAQGLALPEKLVRQLLGAKEFRRVAGPTC